MRVLFLSHLFLPNHPAGTEIHTAELALALRELGVEPEVFCTEKDIGRPDRSLHRRTFEGIVVHELVNNLFYENFRQTWDWPPAADALGKVLDERRPDLVHVMHLMYLSVGCLEEVRRRGIPVVFTLHDFWLTCPRFGQLRHADGSICHEVDFERCGTCIARTKYAQTPLQRRVARMVASIKTVSGVDLSDTIRRAGLRVSKTWHGHGPPAPRPRPDEGPEKEMAQAARVRSEELQRRAVAAVDRFYAPSRFMRGRLVAWGLPPERVEHVPNGVDLERCRQVRRRERAPDDPVRVAFLGTLAAHKAPHLLLEAWAVLPPALRWRGELALIGPAQHEPDYVRGLEARAAELGARLPGALEREAVPRALAAIDLLVVPSVWYENAPLVLLEARATRTPVLCSDLGGMAELVVEGHTGWRFPAGDVAALAAHLQSVLEDPDRLAALDFEAEPVLDTVEAARAMHARYGALLADRADGGTS